MRFNQIKKFIDTMGMPYEHLVDYTIKNSNKNKKLVKLLRDRLYFHENNFAKH